MDRVSPKPRAIALLPFPVFVVFYTGLSLLAGDFYKVPMPAAFAVASAVAFFLNYKKSLAPRIETYTRGMGHSDIMTMALIFILAGSFTAVARASGAVDAAVSIAQLVIPAHLMLAGVFVVSCLISLAVGTSCGTIAAVTPIALGFVSSSGMNPAILVGAVVGGAMFGDNLSLISDTTVAATRTQGVPMKAKFEANIKIVAPVAIAAVIIYSFLGSSGVDTPLLIPVGWQEIILVLPYIFILALALVGANVMVLLFSGTLISAIIGVGLGKFDFLQAVDCAGKGIIGMSETLIVALLAGGLFAIIREDGGIASLVNFAGKIMKGKRTCEAGIAMLVATVNAFTANNTVAIVITGPVAKECAAKYNVNPVRTASILDTVSCVVQGMIPYGAQILIALGVAKTAKIPLDSFSLIGSMIYPPLLAFAVFIAIVFSNKINWNPDAKNEVKKDSKVGCVE